MKKTLRTILVLVLALALLVPVFSFPASAANGYKDDFSNNVFLKLDSIEGESTDSKHGKWIDVLSFSHASIQSIQTGSPDATGRGIYEPVVFKHVVDSATPKIQYACMRGENIKSAQLEFCRVINAKQETVYVLKLENIKIVKAIVETEETEEGETRLVETVHMLVAKQTWNNTSVGSDNRLGEKTEASFDQVKKASMFDSTSSIVAAVSSVVAFLAVVTLVIVLVGKKKKKKAVAAVASEDDK